MWLVKNRHEEKHGTVYNVWPCTYCISSAFINAIGFQSKFKNYQISKEKRLI